ncbi:MAG: extracellular solute-binding protein [Planctomycetota bacterium]|nr:extracellular solute-binding protein [Planctomycetota bacterium]
MSRPKRAPKRKARRAPLPTAALEPGSDLPLYAQLMELLKQEILERGLKPGERLRSERELMRAYGLSYPTVTRALRELVHAGILERRQGKGTFVRGRPEAAPPAATKRARELVLSGTWAPHDEALLQRALERFARNNPGVRVRREEEAHAGAPRGDLFRTIGNQCWRIAEWAAPLDGLAESLREAERPHPAALEAFRHAGRQVGLPRSFAACVLYYRRDLFRAAGLAEPHGHGRWSWNDLLAAATALQDPSKQRLGLAVFPVLGYAMPYLWQAGARLWDEARRTSLPDRAAALRAFEFYRTLYRLAPPELRVQGEEIRQTLDRFAKGQVAMTIWGGYLAAHLRAQYADCCPEGEAWAVAPLPYGPEGSAHAQAVLPGGPTLIFSEGLCLHRAAADHPLALALLRELTGPESARDLAQAGYRLAALPSSWERDPITEAFERNLPAGRLNPDSRHAELFRKADWALSALFTTEAPTEEILEGAARSLQALLDAGADAPERSAFRGS